MNTVREILERIKNRLTTHYGDRFRGLILYGSEARGESTPGSDIDLFVLLHGEFNRLDELRAIVDLLYPFQLEADRLISARPVSVEDYERNRVQLYRSA